MKVEILKGATGQRWLRVEGSGLVVELRPGEPVAARKSRPSKTVKKPLNRARK